MKLDGRRWLTWGASAFAIAALLAWTLWPRPTPVDTGEVTRGPLVVTLEEEGETRVRERFVVSSPVPGQLLRIELEPGDRVFAGKTALAVLQPREPTLLDARSRAETEAQVHALEAELERAKHTRDASSAELDFAKLEHTRARKLESRGVLSAGQLDAAELAEKRSVEALDAAEHTVEGAAHRLSSVRARLIDLGNPDRRGDDPIRLHAPIDGVVLRRIHESEAMVVAGEPLIEIGDTHDLEIVADYLSSDAVKIRPGARVIIDRWGGDGALQGNVHHVEPAGFTKVSALGVEEQRVNVVIDLESPVEQRQGLADGFRVETRIVVWESDDTVRVPAGSLFRSGDGWAVFAIDGGRARLRAIEIGARTPALVEVLGGLDAGDLVVQHPGDDVEDGVRVVSRTLPY